MHARSFTDQTLEYTFRIDEFMDPAEYGFVVDLQYTPFKSTADTSNGGAPPRVHMTRVVDSTVTLVGTAKVDWFMTVVLAFTTAAALHAAAALVGRDSPLTVLVKAAVSAVSAPPPPPDSLDKWMPSKTPGGKRVRRAVVTVSDAKE
jgi:hypothetical protein